MFYSLTIGSRGHSTNQPTVFTKGISTDSSLQVGQVCIFQGDAANWGIVNPASGVAQCRNTITTLIACIA